MTQDYYDKMFADSPVIEPLDADSAALLATYLEKFNTDRLQKAILIAAQAAITEELSSPEKLRNFLGDIRDAVNCELDCSNLSEQEQKELSRLKVQLDHSVYVSLYARQFAAE